MSSGQVDSKSKEGGNKITNIKRNKNASLDMVIAHFHDWLEKQGWGNSEAFEFSNKIGNKLMDLEEDGFLVILRGESRCFHCGVEWPKDWNAEFGKEMDVTWCSKCQDKRKEFLPAEACEEEE